MQQIVGDSRGNIYYTGSSGIVKQIQNRTETKNKFKNVKGMNFVSSYLHNYSISETQIRVKKILINEHRNRLHCLIVKNWRTPWIFSVFKKKVYDEEISVETYVLDPLEYHHQFNNSQFHK